jgi:uncharacterized protein YndB with AHSA1/START domain
MKNRTTVERKSERELVVTRIFNGPRALVFEAWTKPELFRQWWVPKSMGMSLLSCELDARTGGRYRLVYGPRGLDHGVPRKYIEVTPHSPSCGPMRKVRNGAVTTVTFEDKGGKTLPGRARSLSLERKRSRSEHGMEEAMGETFEQLDDLLVTLGGAGDGHVRPTQLTVPTTAIVSSSSMTGWCFWDREGSCVDMRFGPTPRPAPMKATGPCSRR